MAGRFELMEDDETGRKYWFGAEDSWIEGTEIGEDDGMLKLSIDTFPVGTVLVFTEPDDVD